MKMEGRVNNHVQANWATQPKFSVCNYHLKEENVPYVCSCHKIGYVFCACHSTAPAPAPAGASPTEQQTQYKKAVKQFDR